MKSSAMNAKTHLLSAISALLLASLAQADDTDIYLSSSATLGGKPLVMFSLDYRSNLGSTVCTGTECDSLKTAGYLPNDGSTINFFQLLRAVLRKVTDDLGPQLNDVKLGLMMNHNQGSGASCAGPTATKCTDGGYMLLGFTAADTTTMGNRFQVLHDKLAAIPLP
ncbi:MAG: hypothetical protein H6R26_995, partial [Proteobacteria bacterium]|nr:hypothetical protein [Pseudomonadota bacterium]